MPEPRANQINLDVTPYYHCYVRCVRKGYLFGTGENNKNYDHRRAWVIERANYLIKGFAIEICSFAVMSNHYHIVLRVDKDKALAWSDAEVNERWKLVLNRKTELPIATPEEISRRRKNLYSISWYMRFINEYIARLANKEDDAKGRFWESRFQCQALLDEAALLACMAYVDLNPIRSNRAKTLQTSDYTSIQERLSHPKTPTNLIPFQDEVPQENIEKVFLPFSRHDYFSLIDWTGRHIRDDKPGFITADVPSIVQSTGLNPAHWIKTVEKSGIQDHTIFGSLSAMKAWAQRIKKCWLKGQTLTQLKYLTT